jgi:anti-sigma-K factor RskA
VTTEPNKPTPGREWRSTLLTCTAGAAIALAGLFALKALGAPFVVAILWNCAASFGVGWALAARRKS